MNEQMDDLSAVQQHNDWLTIETAKRAASGIKGPYTQHGGWTPLYWPVMDEERLTVHQLAILGRVLGYCQGPLECCNVSQRRLARDCRVSPSQIQKALIILENRGLIRDVTPNLEKKRHIYEDTGKTGRIMERPAGRS